MQSKLPYSLNEDEPSIIGGLGKGDASGTHILESHLETVFHDASAKPTETEDQDTLTPTTELLRLHYRLGHLPFSQLRSMAATGFLPKRLLQARIPKCAACMYGKATRRAWRSKAPPSKVGGRNGDFPWTVRLRGPDAVPYTRADWATQRSSHHSAIYGRNDLCRPFQPPFICPLAAIADLG